MDSFEVDTERAQPPRRALKTSLGAMLRTLPRALILLAIALCVGFVSVIWNLAALLMHPVVSEAWGLRVGRMVIARVYRAAWGLAQLAGLLRLDARALRPLRDEPGLIVVCNHPTVLDALLVVASLPKSACVMKSSLMRNPLLGPGARLARYIRNDTPISLVRQCVRDLKRGGQLVLFPEGTRTIRHPLNPFFPGITVIAKLAKAPIQTVFIDTDTAYTTKGWPLWRMPAFPVKYTLRLGERFEPARDEQAALVALETYMTTHVRTHVADNQARAASPSA
jgi:1-acyl-sn-glycerol-3-phosphate acyltransferase